MGEVWRALDTELDRQVAVKILPESFASNEDRLERFHREAKALAALSHPNLLDIYDLGATDGIHYAVTELLEGDTLRERITPSGLPWKKVTSIGAAVADGLAAAHGRGIIHRDLKPENLFLTADGRVKILDFGLASVQEEASPDARTATITEAGTVMGTPGYMSPEQVKGQPADARSDIFSLGCVLYEMVSGHRAFSGDTGAEVIAAILKEEPPQLSSSGAAVPVDLERAVHRCLEKRPEARFQSAADLAYSLRGVGHSGTEPVMATPQPSPVTDVTRRPRRRWRLAVAAALVVVAALTSWWALTRDAGDEKAASTAVEIVPNRYAVVPFENRTGDPSLDSIGVMAADRIAQGLAAMEVDQYHSEADMVPSSRIRELLATGTPATATAIADATGARIVVMGSFIRRGDQLEFDGSITDSSTGEVFHAFEPVAVSVDDPGTAIATLRNHTVIVVTDHVSPVFGIFADKNLPVFEAYELFMAGVRTYWASGDPAQALGLLQRAMEIDPDFNRVRFWLLMPAPDESARPLLDELERRSDQLTAKQLLFIQAKKAQYARNWEAQFRALRDLIELAPGYRYLYRFAITAAVFSNRPRAAVGYWKKAEALGGEDRGDWWSAAEAFHLLGRYEEELALVENVLLESSNSDMERQAQARALVALNRLDEVEQLVGDMLKSYQARGESGWFMAEVSLYLRAHGHLEQARAMADRAAEWFGRALETEVSPDLQIGYLKSLLNGDRFDELAAAAGEIHDPDNWNNLQRLLYLGIAAAGSGDRSSAVQASERLNELGELPNYPRPWTTYYRSGIAAHLGDREEALRLLRQSISEGMPYGIWFHLDRVIEPLRDDPEFQETVWPKG
ncbi:MAG TPA: serine/threonine-protein kinase [Candidatus Sulfomarinibacteraceae bacterium]|nr:serine/threonine-protein kinase [Candidatus Sulfomarinibacteraceae bacterium]